MTLGIARAPCPHGTTRLLPYQFIEPLFRKTGCCALPANNDWARHERVLLGHQPQQVVIREIALMQSHLPVLHRTPAEQLLRTANFPYKLLNLTPLEGLRLQIAKLTD